MRTILGLLSALAVLTAGDAIAQTFNIGPIKNTNPSDVSSLSAECRVRGDGQRMTCDFVQVSVRMKLTPEKATAVVQKALAEFRVDEAGTLCTASRKEMAKLRETVTSTPDVPPRFKEFFAEWFRKHDAFCDKPNRDTFRAFFSHGIDRDTKTCRIWTNPWQETFTKSLGGKWVSNRGPSGVCGVVTVSTLEAYDSGKAPREDLLWTYQTQKIVTDKSVGREFCFFDESKVTYGWDAKEFDRSCEFIEFGF